MTFEHTWTDLFSDADPFSIAHYPRIVDAIHKVSDMFMEELGFPFWGISREHGVWLPLIDKLRVRRTRGGERRDRLRTDPVTR